MHPLEKATEAVRKSSKESKVYIGCDSIRFKKGDRWFARYATVIILHIDGNRGCRVFCDQITEPDYGGIKERLLREVGLAIDAYSFIENVVEDRVIEIHIDINTDPKYKSNPALNQAKGWIKGMGLIPIEKPNSIAASTAADYCVRKP